MDLISNLFCYNLEMFEDFIRENLLSNSPVIVWGRSSVSKLNISFDERLILLEQGSFLVMEVKYYSEVYRFRVTLKKINNRYAHQPSVEVEIFEEISNRELDSIVRYSDDSEESIVGVIIDDEIFYKLLRIENIDVVNGLVTIEAIV